LIPAQIKALRGDMTQNELASVAQMKQSRISAIETPGAVNFNLETLVRLASAFKVGMVVKFVPFSEMLSWENGFSQDSFRVVTVEQDERFNVPIAASPIPIAAGGEIQPTQEIAGRKLPMSVYLGGNIAAPHEPASAAGISSHLEEVAQ
jgi:transcriptional regulator with XRE-family HTH domain